MATNGKRFELWDADEQPPVRIDPDVDLGAFAVLNDLEPETLNTIGALPVGGSVPFGGGAAPLFTLWRVA